MDKRPVIVFDQDGVLSDFVGGVRRAFGLRPEWVPRNYDLYEEVGVSVSDFWGIIESNPTFWIDLDPDPDYITLLRDILRKDKADVIVGTSPARDPKCPGQKIEWLRMHVPELPPENVAVLLKKHLLAAPGRILIDDRPKNIMENESCVCRILTREEYIPMKKKRVIPSAEVTYDLLLLVCRKKVPRRVVRGLPSDDRAAAAEYAAAAHLQASDNPVRVPKAPAWLRKYL